MSSKKTKTPSSRNVSVVRISTPESIVDEVADYEDDFEDYESQSEAAVVQEVDDYEVVSSPDSVARPEVKTPAVASVEMGESVILRRVAQSRTSASSSLSTSYSRQERPVTSANRTFRFDHKAAVNTEAALKGALKFKQVKELLSSEFISSVDIPPNRQADYLQLVSNERQRQRYTETNEDKLFSWTQTTPRRTLEVGGQWPENGKNEERPSAVFLNPNRRARPERFLQFIDVAGQVFTQLLAAQPTTHEYYFPMRSNYSFSNGFIQLTPPSRNKLQSIGAAAIVKAATLILVGYYAKSRDEKRLINQSTIVVYELAEQPKPKRVLITDDEVTDFCCSTTGKEVVFAGMRNGGYVLWNLAGHSSDPSVSLSWMQLPETTIKMRPDYSTTYSSVEKRGVGMKTNLDVSVVQVGALKPDTVSEQQQFVSLTAGGMVIVWAVGREVQSATDFDSDPGLGHNSSVHLTKTSVVLCSTLSAFGCGRQIALNMHVNAFNSRDLLIGVQHGGLIRIARGGSGLRHYFLNKGSYELNCHLSVTALHASPFEADYFVVNLENKKEAEFGFQVGASDGTLLVYDVQENVPRMSRSFEREQQRKVTSISQIAWSTSHAQILYVIYKQRFLAVWNLASKTEPPIIDLSDEFKSPIRRVFCWQDSRRIPLITMVLESGEVLIHQLARPHETSVELREIFG